MYFVIFHIIDFAHCALYSIVFNDGIELDNKLAVSLSSTPSAIDKKHLHSPSVFANILYLQTVILLSFPLCEQPLTSTKFR